MKHFIQILVTILIFGFIVAFSAVSANAASPKLLSSELPPEIFDEDCDGSEACPGTVFADMPDVEHWSHLAIDWALSRHITLGVSENLFSPKSGCTRAQAVTFMWRAAGSPEPRTTGCAFGDVSETSYYRKAVLWASEQGITNGTSATTFSPNLACTRGQIITLLWRAAGSPAVSVDSFPFRDVRDGVYYRDAVIWAAREHITNGTSATTFSPKAVCTRAQIVTFLYHSEH